MQDKKQFFILGFDEKAIQQWIKTIRFTVKANRIRKDARRFLRDNTKLKDAPHISLKDRKICSPPKGWSKEGVEKLKKEKEELNKYLALAKEKLPEPFSKPQLKSKSSEEEYKKYMAARFEYETWENEILRIANKLKNEANGISTPSNIDLTGLE